MWPTIAVLLATALHSQVNPLEPAAVVQQPPLVVGEWQTSGPQSVTAEEAGYASGDYCCDSSGGLFADPCVFNSYWDVTGGRSPTDWVCGYGPECHIGTARIEWLLWFSRGRDAPVLARALTTSGKIVEYPEEPIGLDVRHGARITLGRLLSDGATWAEGRFWGLEDSSETFATDSSHSPIITRPFFNVTTGQQSTRIVAAPTVATGNIHILSKSDLIGADAWLRHVWWEDDRHRLSFLAGYQFSRLDDSIVVRESSAFASGFVGSLQDSFRTQNEFHGASLGFVSNWRKRWLSLEVLGKFGLGGTRQTVIIEGQATGTPLGGPTSTIQQGFLAGPSNSGAFTRHQFTFVPELNVNGVVHLSPRWQLLAGYSIICWNNVVLAGNEISTRINPAPFSFHRSVFWVQGVNLGAEYRW